MADRCEEFLAKQESWIRAILKGEDESPDILPALAQTGGIDALNKARDEYEQILKQCRWHLAEYRKQLARNGAESALWGVPSMPSGAPRQDALAREARELEQAGLSQSHIAASLNSKYPNRKDRKGNKKPFTAESIRKLLGRRRGTSPDKI
jgi:hypothetical protein